MTRDRPGMSLRRRLLAATLTAVAVLWLAAALFAYLDTRHEIDELLDGYLAQTGALLIAQAGEDAGEIDVEHAPELHKYARHLAFQVWAQGHLRLHSANAPDRPLSSATDGFSNSTIDGQHWRVFSSRNHEHDVLVHVGELRHERDELSGGIARSLLLPLAITLPLLAMLLWPAVGLGLQPLQRLRREVERREPGNLEPLVVGLGAPPAEVAPLVTSLDRLLERVRRSIEHEKRFTADAAHELRTPIAALRAQVQVALGAESHDERRRALAQVIAGCDRATRLMAQLLTLARLEPADSVPPAQPCDIAAIARSVLADAAPAALEKNTQVELDAQCPASVEGNVELLALLVRNLVDNAVRYSPPGSTARVTVTTVQDAVELSVSDNGPGVSAEALPRLGERFFREPGSSESGSGLGLSIVRRVAELHGATVAFKSNAPNAGLTVSVRFARTFAQARPECGNATYGDALVRSVRRAPS